MSGYVGAQHEFHDAAFVQGCADRFVPSPPRIALFDLILEQVSAPAPVRWHFPDPTPATLLAQVVSANAPRPNAARLFHEWSLTPEGQLEWFKYMSVSPSRADVVDPRKAAKKHWYAEDWYADPTNLYLAHLNEPEYGNPAKPIIARWNEIFDYQGAPK